MHAQNFSLSFPVREDLLKFETTAWNKFIEISTVQAPGRPNPWQLHGDSYTFAINKLDLRWQDFTVAKLAFWETSVEVMKKCCCRLKHVGAGIVK